MTNTNDTAEPSGASAGSVANPLEQIIRGTVRLHELIERGRCDSEEADAVRDAMEAPFLALGESERETARMVSAAIKDRDWIPVTERLPEHGDAIWVYDGKDVFMGEYWQGSGFQFYGAFVDREGINIETLHGVTHWMEIDEPEPPEVK
jgi:hypothetical protein